MIANALDGSLQNAVKEITITSVIPIEPALVSSMTIGTQNGEDAVVEGSTLQMTVQVEPSEASDEVAWSVGEADSDKASIDQNGVLTGIQEGTVTVIANALDGSLQSTDMSLAITSAVPVLTIGLSEGMESDGVKPTYIIVIPAKISLGTMVKDSGIISRGFSIEAQNVNIEDGYHIKVSVLSDFVMKDKDGMGLVMLSYMLKNSLSTQITSGSAITTFSSNRTETGAVSVDTSNIVNAGRYMGIMDFLIVYE